MTRRPSCNKLREVLDRRNIRGGDRNLPDLICSRRCQDDLDTTWVLSRLDIKMPLIIFLREIEGRARLAVRYDNSWGFGVVSRLADLQGQE